MTTDKTPTTQAQAQADSVQEDACHAPPLGWRCTRKAGHEGPCAAVEYEDEKQFVERGMQRIRDAEDAARLDFLIDQRAYVVSDPDACPGHWLHWARPDGRTWVQGDEHPTPRAAIDTARKQGEKQ